MARPAPEATWTRTELAAAEAASTLPDAPAAEAIEALVVALHTGALADPRFQARR